jgi:hypothetical protein
MGGSRASVATAAAKEKGEPLPLPQLSRAAYTEKYVKALVRMVGGASALTLVTFISVFFSVAP